MILEGANAKLMFNNLIPLSMKRIFVLLIVALMSAVMVNAKTVRGYVSDKDGNPVVGMKMVVRYRETSTGIRIVIEPSQKKERALAASRMQ